MGILLQDVRYGLRTLRKSPGFTAVAVLTLALGIGATTAIFSVVYGVVLRPLPYPEPGRIVQLAENYRGEWDEKDVTYPQWQFLQQHASPFHGLAAFTVSGANLALAGESERLNLLDVSSQYFDVLGVKPTLGRTFSPEEDRGDGARVAVLSYELWKRRAGGSSSVLGRTVTLDGEPYTVIGVMPPAFERLAPNPLIRGNTDVWRPLALVRHTAGAGENLAVVGRLKAGIGFDEARARIAAISDMFRNTFPGELAPGVQLTLERYQTMLSVDVSTILFILLGAIGFVLLIACANVANLLLGRAAARGREMALRTALGASRPRLFRQLLTESVLLSSVGGIAGFVVALFGLRLLLRLSPTELPRISDIRIDGWVFSFTILLAVFTGVVFGLVPAFQTRYTGMEALKQGLGRFTGGRTRSRVRGAVAISEVALSLVLLTGAALLTETFWNLLRVDPGFQPRHVVAMQLWLTGTKYNSSASVANLYNQVTERVESLPGIQLAAIVGAGLPLERGGNIGVSVPGKRQPDGAFGFRVVSPEYFHVMHIPLQLGRVFERSDDENAAPVAIISQSFAGQEFRRENPIGAHLKMVDVNWQIVGVVGDVKSYLDRPAQPTVFIPVAQVPYKAMQMFGAWFPTELVARTTGEPLAFGHALQQAVRQTEPAIAVGHIRSMEEVRSGSVSMRQFNMMLLVLFAATAMLLAIVGVYGVISLNVAQRTQEMGVRLALGAKREDVLRLVLGEGLRLALIGIAAGLVATFALTRVLQSFLYGVNPGDPLVLASMAALLGAAALLASYFPARRAMRVEPVVALRYE